MLKEKKVIDEQEQLNDYGFSIPVKAVLELNFRKGMDNDSLPISAYFKIESMHHVELLRAVINKYFLSNEEHFFYDENIEGGGGIEIRLPAQGLTFGFPY